MFKKDPERCQNCVEPLFIFLKNLVSNALNANILNFIPYSIQSLFSLIG
jgi:hypothetical protein